MFWNGNSYYKENYLQAKSFFSGCAFCFDWMSSGFPLLLRVLEIHLVIKELSHASSSFLLLLDEKGDWFSVQGQLQLTSAICHSLSSTYLFSEITLAFLNFFFYPPPCCRPYFYFLVGTQGAWHMPEMESAEARLKKNRSVLGRKEQVEGTLWRRAREGAKRIALTSVDGTMQTPAVQRAPPVPQGATPPTAGSCCTSGSPDSVSQGPMARADTRGACPRCCGSTAGLPAAWVCCQDSRSQDRHCLEKAGQIIGAISDLQSRLLPCPWMLLVRSVLPPTPPTPAPSFPTSGPGSVWRRGTEHSRRGSTRDTEPAPQLRPSRPPTGAAAQPRQSPTALGSTPLRQARGKAPAGGLLCLTGWQIQQPGEKQTEKGHNQAEIQSGYTAPVRYGRRFLDEGLHCFQKLGPPPPAPGPSHGRARVLTSAVTHRRRLGCQPPWHKKGTQNPWGYPRGVFLLGCFPVMAPYAPQRYRHPPFLSRVAGRGSTGQLGLSQRDLWCYHLPEKTLRVNFPYLFLHFEILRSLNAVNALLPPHMETWTFYSDRAD